MSVFRDVSGRRGRAVRVASVLGVVSALAALGVFFVSIFPAQWSRRASEVPEPAPAAKLPAGHPLQSRARERVYRNEQGRLNLLLAEAQAAQKRRKKADAREPVLAGVGGKRGAPSLQAAEAPAGRLPDGMPGGIRPPPDGGFLVEEAPR